MTFKDYSYEEKLAVIAVVKGIMMAHKGIESDELEYIEEHINNENFPDYSEIFKKFDETYTKESQIYEAFAEIEREEVKEQLIDLALNLAASSGLIDVEEVEIITHMCEIWGYEDKILEVIDEETQSD